MADASDSKSDEGDLVWVQVPSPASLFTTESEKAHPKRCASSLINWDLTLRQTEIF